MSLVQEALADVGVSVEEFQDIPPEATVEDTVIPPQTQEPSVSIPVAPETVAATAPVAEVPVTPEAIVEVVEVAEPIVDNVVAEHEALQAKADEIVALQTSMEQYKGLIRKAGFNGITPQTAEFLQVHMKIADRVLGRSGKIGSMESFSAKDPREQHALATVSLEDIRATSKAAVDRFIEIVMKIVEFIKRSGQQLWDGIIQVEKAVDQLDKQLAGIKNAGASGDIKVKVPTMFFKVGGEIDRTVSPDVHGLAHFASQAYPEAVVKFFDGMTKGVLKFDPEGAGMEELDAFFAQYVKPLQFLIDQKADTDELPGGYHMDISENRLSVGIKRPEKMDTQVEEVEVRPTVELRKVTRDLKSLVAQLKEIRPETEKISAAGKKLTEATKRAAAKGGEGTGDVYGEMAMKVGQMVQEASPRAGEIISYVIHYIKEHCTSIASEIQAIQKPAAEA